MKVANTKTTPSSTEKALKPPPEATARSICAGDFHGEALHREVAKLSEAELLAFMRAEDASRAIRIAAIANLAGVDLLVALVESDAPTFVRRDALCRLEEVLDGTPLAPEHVERLLPCLDDEGLIAFTVALMDASGCDWCARVGESVVFVLCAAMSACRSINESVLLEDAFAQLAHSRPDLRADLQVCLPESFIPRNVYTPMIASDLVLVDNVA